MWFLFVISIGCFILYYVGYRKKWWWIRKYLHFNSIQLNWNRMIYYFQRKQHNRTPSSTTLLLSTPSTTLDSVESDLDNMFSQAKKFDLSVIINFLKAHFFQIFLFHVLLFI